MKNSTKFPGQKPHTATLFPDISGNLSWTRWMNYPGECLPQSYSASITIQDGPNSCRIWKARGNGHDCTQEITLFKKHLASQDHGGHSDQTTVEQPEKTPVCRPLPRRNRIIIRRFAGYRIVQSECLSCELVSGYVACRLVNFRHLQR